MRTTFTILLTVSFLGLIPAIGSCQEPAGQDSVAGPASGQAMTNLSAEREAKLLAELARTTAALEKAQQSQRPNQVTITRLAKKAGGLRQQLGIGDETVSARCPFGGPGPVGGQFGLGPVSERTAGTALPGAGRGRGPGGQGMCGACPCGRCPRQSTDAAPQSGRGRGPAAGASGGGAGRGGPRGGGYGRGAGAGRGRPR